MNKFGYVVITGKPNVGKSTLINSLLKRKVSITSYKPQTTRNLIKALYVDNNSKIVFLDTPGYHEPNNKLDQFLNSQIKLAYKQVNCALLLIDPTREFDAEDEAVIKLLKSFKIEKTILVFTKKDIASATKTLALTKKISELIDICSTIILSAKNNENLDQLINEIKKNIPDNDNDFDSSVNEDDNLLISELVREQIIYNTKQEIPYSCAVFIQGKTYDKKTNFLNIQADIIVEKKSQIPILLGHGGTMIKKIGTNARKELLSIFDCKINLKLFVKCKEDWRNNSTFLKDLNYN